MTAADLTGVVVVVATMAYAVLGGADFGAGIWDLLAGHGEEPRPRQRRALIDHAIGPVWEVNHIWVIVVLVVLWTGFPVGFASVMSTLWIPFALATLGIILRGSAFAMRRVAVDFHRQRLLGATFAGASLLTPFFLGAAVGGLVSGRVPIGNAAGHPVTSWCNPTGILGGTLAVAVCAYLGAVFLYAVATSQRRPNDAAWFRQRALIIAVATGALAATGIFVLAIDAPVLFDGLTHRALPVVLISTFAGVASIALLLRHQASAARITAVLAVTTIIGGWGVAQYPYLVIDSLTLADAAAPTVTLRYMLLALAGGALLLAPAFWLLYSLDLKGVLHEESSLDEEPATGI